MRKQIISIAKTFNPKPVPFTQNPIPNKKCTKREVLQLLTDAPQWTGWMSSESCDRLPKEFALSKTDARC
ncbi:MAG: hypothetical protein ACYTXI_33800 [Nostoc sp.]